jgi:hypothetical protein
VNRSTIHRVLVVATAPFETSNVPAEIRGLAERDEVEMRVVAPAAHLSPLRRLANDEDEARAEAEEVAGEAASLLDAEEAETPVGDPDPVQAIEDALRTFPADELVVVTPPDDQAGWLESGSAAEALDRFGLPVTHVVSGGEPS